MLRAVVAFAWLGIAATAHPATAQPTPADPLDLVRGLRDNGQPELALELLKDIEAKRPTPGVLAVIPLERARVRLELAAGEAADTRRAAIVAEAKADFDRFLAANATHPRRAEAALALARLVSVEAKGMVSKANKQADAATRSRELTAARPVFKDAAARFSQAAAAFAKTLDDDTLTAKSQRILKDDLYQARLDEAVNLLELARTISTAGATADDLVERGKAVTAAGQLFEALATSDPSHPIAWVAKAWVGETLLEKDQAVDAQKLFDEVKKQAQREPAVARAGGRTARFFEARADFLKAVGSNSVPEMRKSQAALEKWLAEAAGGVRRQTPEMAAALFYVATAKVKQAEANIKPDPVTNEPTLRGDARQLLRSAERDFRRLRQPENDYSVRAAEARTDLMRKLIGDPDKIDLATLSDYETGLMLAQVQFTRAVREGDSAEARKGAGVKAVAAFERLRQLPVPPEFAREAPDVAANLAYAYLLADQPYQAAVLGESVARSESDPATAARAGLIALNAYRAAVGTIDAADAVARRRDLDRAVAVGLLLDKRFPYESYTDSARLQVVRDYLASRRYLDAFRMAARVADGSPVVLDARYLESVAAVELLRAPPPGIEPSTTLTPVEKADLFQKSLADLRNAPAAAPGTPRGEARLAVFLFLQRAELHLLNDLAGLPQAEAAAAEAEKLLPTLTELTPDDRLELQYRIELTKMRAVWGQALLAFQAGKSAEAVAKLAPILDQARKTGKTTSDDMAESVAAVAGRVDAYRRDKVVGLAIQARVREGAIDKVGELLDLLKKLGGSLADSSSTLSVMIDGVRPQIETLRRDGKAAEADALAAGIGSILDKVAAEPDIKPPTIITLAEGLNSVGNHAAAVAFLKRIPAPADLGLLKTRSGDMPNSDGQLAALRYRNAQLEMLRAYRDAGQFAEADAIVAEAVGDGKPGSGWAANSDFRREAALLLEAKAEAEPAPQAAVKIWGQARALWSEMANQYFVPLNRLSAGRNDPKLLLRALVDLRSLPAPRHPKLPATDDAVRAGLAEQTPPPWLAELTADNPDAVAFAEDLRNEANRLETRLKPLYHDLLFESLRCGVRANASLLKDNPAGLATKLEGYARQVVAVETANPDLADTVRAKFIDLLGRHPTLREQYRQADGKAFLPAGDVSK